MTKTEYPSKVTENNLNQLNEKATQIKDRDEKRNTRLMLSTLILYPTFGIIYGFGVLLLVLILALLLFPDFPNEVSLAFIYVLSIVSLPFVFLLLNLLDSALIKIFKLPRYDETIFAECFIIANHLANNERRQAIKEALPLVRSLRGFLKGSDFRRKIYAHEFNLLISGKREIRRMLLFSKDKIPESLRDFGLALVRNEDTEAFASLKQILSEVERYGKLKGKLGILEMLAGLDKYQTFVTLISFIIAVILVILGILPSL